MARQRGAALMVALIILAALTLLGLAAMSGNTLQQKMSHGAAQTNLAFQAAETGLAQGEYWLQAQSVQPVAGCTKACSADGSVWPAAAAGSTPFITADDLHDASWWATEGRVSADTLPNVAHQPQFVIEELGHDPSGSLVLGGPRTVTLWYYRVTARGSGSLADGPPAVVQSVFTKGF